jgi:hypothetical protein
MLDIVQERNKPMDRREIDAYAVALDETEFYDIDPDDTPYIERIISVYLFDRNEIIRCCELTPSYYLIHLYDFIVFTADNINGDIQRLLDEKYMQEASGDRTVRCKEIDRIIDADREDQISYYGDYTYEQSFDFMEDADERHCAEMMAIAEELQSNYPF